MECDGNTTDCVSSNGENDFSLGTAGSIEVGILVCILIVGGPLNVMSFHKSFLAFRAHKAKSQILLLRMNLNIADLITLFVFIPRQIIWMITYQWYGGELLCRANMFFSTFSFYLNSFVIACIAVDRVFGAYNISSLNAHRRAYRRCRNLLSFGWGAAIVLSLPQIFIWRLFKPFDDFSQCVTIWTVVKHENAPILLIPNLSADIYSQVELDLMANNLSEHWYNVAHLLFMIWVPCIIIIVSYLTVLLILQGHLRQDTHSTVLGCCFGETAKTGYHDDYNSPPPSSMAPNEETAVILKMKDESFDGGKCVTVTRVSKTPRLGAVAVTTIHKAKQHAKRQAAWIILAYLAFWSPYNLISVLNMAGSGNLVPFPVSYFNALICANSIVNPIIYGLFKKNKR